MMDAVPVTLGQEFGGYAAQIQLGHDRVRDSLERASQIPLGGTATGTGLNTHPEFGERGPLARWGSVRRHSMPSRRRPIVMGWSSCTAL